MQLFGIVDQTPLLRQAFSDASEPDITLGIDVAHLDHVAEHVGLDGEDELNAISRFVAGGWREAADAPAGTTLGNFGEIVTYLRLLTAGMQPIRVLRYDRGRAPVGTDDFPTPDFFFEESGKAGCVEVKTSCPLDYHALCRMLEHPSNHRRTDLTPCSTIKGRWTDALRQLGKTDSAASVPLHDLVLKDERVVRFPADVGLADIHLVHDRRVDGLRAHAKSTRMKTPTACRHVKRNCC